MAKNTFQLSVVTPEKAVMEAEVSSVTFPALDGEIGVLRNRAPMLSKVGIGRLRAETSEGPQELFIDGGFAQMVDNRLTILTEQARPLGEIDRAQAAKDLESALATSFRDERSFNARQDAVQRAKVQMRLSGDN